MPIENKFALRKQILHVESSEIVDISILAESFNPDLLESLGFFHLKAVSRLCSEGSRHLTYIRFSTLGNHQNKSSIFTGNNRRNGI